MDISTTDTIETMARLLSTMGTDLGDEREVIRALTGTKFLSGEVVALMDRAIERARVIAAEAAGA